MRLVEQHIIKRNSVYYNELQDLLHKCKNLYNDFSSSKIVNVDIKSQDYSITVNTQ